jgi:hypothetical protein
MLDLEDFSSGRTREGWWIKNDDVKSLTFPYQARQHRSDIIRDEAMLDC